MSLSDMMKDIEAMERRSIMDRIELATPICESCGKAFIQGMWRLYAGHRPRTKCRSCAPDDYIAPKDAT